MRRENKREGGGERANEREKEEGSKRGGDRPGLPRQHASAGMPVPAATPPGRRQWSVWPPATVGGERLREKVKKGERK